MNSEAIMDTGNHEAQKKYFIYSQVKGLIRKENRVFLELREGEVVLEFLTGDFFRVVTQPGGKTNLSSSMAVVDHQLRYDELEIDELEDYYLLKTEKLILRVYKDNFALGIYDSEGNLIHQDYRERALGWSGKEVRVWKEKKTRERFYGLGEKTGFLDKNGKNYTMWNTDVFEAHTESTDALYQSIPFFMGFKEGQAYGIYFDNTYRSYFDFGSKDSSFYSFGAEGGKLDYYFIYGPEMKKVLFDYTRLTGRMSLPPRWSLGYQQSRYSYHPEGEVRELATRFREKEIPCDVIYLDIHYMEGYRVFTWNQVEFPEPKKMLTDLSRDGFKVITIIDPGVKKDPEYTVFREGIKRGMFCKYLEGSLFTGKVWPGECVFPDFTRKEVREWWGELHQELLEAGVKGIWNDMNEPAVFAESGTMDLEVIHDNDGNPGTHREFHNTYALYENMATYEGMKKHTGQRPFILTRAGFAGIQRYAAVWTGDNRSIWQHLKFAIPMLLNFGLSGVAFAGTDVGGFTGDTDGELLTRWIQTGVFTPFFRNHYGLNHIDQEPWSFGEPYESIIKSFIRLRYRLLPYLYTLFYECSESGVPIIRPLVMEFPSDEETYNLSDQFMVGENILVAPVLEPDKRKRLVYLPEGRWYDYWTGKEETGKSYIISEAPLDRIPIYFKGGSIVPFTEAVNYIGEQESGTLELRLYLSDKLKEGQGLIYEDDGESFAFRDGSYNLGRFTFYQQDEKLTFKIEWEQKGYNPSYYTDYLLKVFNLEKEPKKVLMDGGSCLKWEYHAQNHKLRIEFRPEVRDIEIYY